MKNPTFKRVKTKYTNIISSNTIEANKTLKIILFDIKNYEL